MALKFDVSEGQVQSRQTDRFVSRTSRPSPTTANNSAVHNPIQRADKLRFVLLNLNYDLRRVIGKLLNHPCATYGLSDESIDLECHDEFEMT